ncbi:MAG: hypothetical protein ACE1Z4_09105 [Gammaproteobacteria bacterium]
MNDTTESKEPITENDRWRWLHREVAALTKLVDGTKDETSFTACGVADLEASVLNRFDEIDKKLDALAEKIQPA